jgi:hypothetical protein
MTLVQPATFELASTEKHSFGRIETGTVEVTLGRETRRVRATRWFTNDERYEVEIHAYDLGGRYETSAKVWDASITYTKWADNGKETERANFGRDDRSGRFHKLNGVFFK